MGLACAPFLLLDVLSRAERDCVVGVEPGVARPERRAARLVVGVRVRVRAVGLCRLHAAGLPVRKSGPPQW